MADWDMGIDGRTPRSATEEHVILRGIDEGEQLFGRSEHILEDEGTGSAIIIGEKVNHVLACGHVAQAAQQVIECQRCGARVCQTCQVRCSRCLTVLCNADAKWLWGKLYCAPCRRSTFALECLFALLSWGIGLFIWMLRLVPRFLVCIHRVLSKEI